MNTTLYLIATRIYNERPCRRPSIAIPNIARLVDAGKAGKGQDTLCGRRQPGQRLGSHHLSRGGNQRVCGVKLAHNKRPLRTPFWRG